MLYRNGAGTSYSYQAGNYRLEEMITTDKNGNEIQNLHYTFDNVGNISTINDNKNSVNHSFIYDAVNRLKDAVGVCASDAARRYSQAFTYDLAGNIEKKTGLGGYNVTEWKDPVKHIEPKKVSYNKEVAGVAARDIVYNQDNMPTQITYNGVTTTLTYDGEGNRVKKVKGAETVIYVGDIYEVRNGTATSYIYANGRLVTTISGTTEYYTHADHLGSTSLTTDESGVPVEEIGYLPFGAVLFRNVYNGGTWQSAYKFTGQVHIPADSGHRFRFIPDTDSG